MLQEQKELQLLQDNVVCTIEEPVQLLHSSSSSNDLQIKCLSDNENDDEKVQSTNDVKDSTQKAVAKKRGRKPKGGKIIQQITPSNANKEIKPNIILHLKCSLKELQTNSINTCVESFNFASCKNELNYEVIDSQKNNTLTQHNYNNENVISSQTHFFDDDCDNDYDENYSSKDHDIKDVWKKLKILEHNLHINNISDKKSACFGVRMSLTIHRCISQNII